MFSLSVSLIFHGPDEYCLSLTLEVCCSLMRQSFLFPKQRGLPANAK